MSRCDTGGVRSVTNKKWYTGLLTPRFPVVASPTGYGFLAIFAVRQSVAHASALRLLL
jgi:hypothetical protein